MIRGFVYIYVVALLAWPALTLVASVAHADPYDHKSQVVVSLPSDIAQALRERNHDGRGGCPESSIFVHGYHYLDMGLDRTMWFLGAPDYLCKTNSFISAIVSSSGEWTIGRTSEEDWEGSRMLPGVPILFQYSRTLGFFVTTEWQVEAPGNHMYHSPDGVTWSSAKLPAAERKGPDGNCCFAASVRALCIADSGTVFVSYYESEEFHGGVWSSSVDQSFPTNVTWTQTPELPESAQCSGTWSSSFIPRSLREKTDDGAVFDVSPDWAVRIPGPTN